MITKDLCDKDLHAEFSISRAVRYHRQATPFSFVSYLYTSISITLVRGAAGYNVKLTPLSQKDCLGNVYKLSAYSCLEYKRVSAYCLFIFIAIIYKANVFIH